MSDGEPVASQQPLFRITPLRFFWAWFLFTVSAAVVSAALGSWGWALWDSFLALIPAVAILTEYGVISIDL